MWQNRIQKQQLSLQNKIHLEKNGIAVAGAAVLGLKKRRQNSLNVSNNKAMTIAATMTIFEKITTFLSQKVWISSLLGGPINTPLMT